MQFKKAGWHQRSVMGYKPSEIRVLFCIGKEKRPDAHDMKVSEISKHLHVTPPTVTQLIKGLEANGLVERNIDLADRRAVGITLTDKGEMVTRQATEDFFASINGLIEYLGEEQSDQLAELLVKVSHYYYEENQRINEKTACAEFVHWSGDEDL